LIDAVSHDRFESVDHQLQGMNLELRRDGKTALMHAVERENENVIKKLHHAGAKLDDAFLNAVKNGKANMTHLLLKLGAPTEIKDDQGATPLLIAVTSAHAPIVQKLLDRGVFVDAQDPNGWSVVHIAAHHGNAEIMGILLNPDYHVNLNAVCPKGKTALHYLAEQNNVAKAKMLLQANANAGIKDKHGRTSLDIAIKRRRYEFVKTLIKYNNINVFNHALLKDTSSEVKNLFRSQKLNS
jgi:ankyrin repeat protein